MKKTPQEFKRTEIRQTIERTLRETQTKLFPLTITVAESLNDDFTVTDFSFEQLGDNKKTVALQNQKGKGFVDGLFTGLHRHFREEYKSLDKIKLADYNVNPIMSNSKKSLGTDAQAVVTISVHVNTHGIAEFQHSSRSMIYSSFVAILEAFQFYINCEKAFHKIQLFIEDAQRRNRGDVMSDYIYSLSKLTEVNTYEKAQN